MKKINHKHQTEIKSDVNHYIKNKQNKIIQVLEKFV